MAQSLKATQPSSQVDAMPRLQLQFLNILIRISFLSPFAADAALILAAQVGLGVLTVHCHPELDMDADPSFEGFGLVELLVGSSVVATIAHDFTPFIAGFSPFGPVGLCHCIRPGTLGRHAPHR
jgi:hypothetical protein